MNYLIKTVSLIFVFQICKVFSYQNFKRAHVDLAYKLLVDDQLRQGKYEIVNNDALDKHLVEESSCEKTCPIECLSGFLFSFFIFF
jgi:hypothetical protein